MSPTRSRECNVPSGKWLYLINIILLWISIQSVDCSEVFSFKVEPSDVLVAGGASVLLDCAADDKAIRNLEDNDVNIRWRGPDGQDIGIVGDTFRTQLPNGSLYISTVEENRGLTGDYQCLLSIDGIGTIRSRLARVQLAKFPETKQDHTELYLALGQTAYFKCLITRPQFGVNYQLQWLKDDMPLRFDKSRMTYLPSGALEIDELIASDRGSYQCNVSSGSISKLSSKQNLNIKTPSGAPENFAAPIFLTDSTAMLVREGDSVTIDCVANGNPKPQVKWLKDGKDIDLDDLDSRFRLIGISSLQIAKVKDSDSGNYQCRAGNIEDSVDIQTTLQVQEPPKFMEKPIDQVALEKDEIEFKCNIRGKPTPIIEWLKNGDKITPNDYMQIVNGHNLRILGLLSTDAGMFQCIGRNTAGSVQASARLTVKDQVKSSDRSIIKSHPKPSVDSEYYDNDYYDNDEDDEEDEYEEKQTFNTRDKNLQKQLFNSLTTEDSDDSKLDVFKITRKPSASSEQTANTTPGAPRDVEAQIVKPRFVTLSWMEPIKNPEEVISYSVFYKMDSSERERKITTKSRDDQQVNIQGLLPGRTYLFRVVANTINGIGDSSNMIEVKTQPEENIAGTPENVQCQVLSDTEIQLTWKQPKVTNGVINKYRIYYSEADVGSELHKDSTFLHAKLTELRPYTEYTISIVPFNQNGMGDSSPEIKVKTHSNIPTDSPRNVTLEPSGVTSITVRWEPPPVEYQNGPITGYKIRYKKQRSTAKLETTPANVRHYEIKDLDRDSLYQVKIAAMNVNGTGPFTEWYNIETFQNDFDETQVPGQPTFIRTRALAESIAINWGTPEKADVRVKVYIIGWGKGIPDEESIEVDEKLRYYEITGLEKNSEYVISVRARNKVGDGPPIYDYVRTREEITIDTPTPLEVPVGLRAITMSATSIVVYWTDTTLSRSQQVTDNRQYVVRYNAAGSNRYKTYNTTDLNCMIADLKSNTQYEFVVKVVKGHRESSWSMSVFNTTQIGVPNLPPRSLLVKSDESNKPGSVVVQWQQPQSSTGQITGYIVYYTNDTTKRDRDWQVVAVVGNVTRASIPNLRPHSTYYFKVQTRSNKGVNGPFSTMVSYSTGQLANIENQGPLSFMDDAFIPYVLSGILICVLLLILIIVLFYCRKKQPSTPDHKESYQKNNAGIKPPDLWIHHDQMELKNMEKNNTLGCSDAASSSGLTLPRSITHDYDPDVPMQTNLMSNTLEKCSYIPSQMSSSVTSTLDRTKWKPQYNERGMIQNDGMIMPPSSQSNSLVQTPDQPYNYDTLQSNYSNPVTYNRNIINDTSKRGLGHPLQSFSVPGPPTIAPFISNTSKHPTPAVTIRPQNSSPYRKCGSVQTSIANRLQNGPIVAHSSDEIQQLAPSTSTEELNQEMANLEGLMKDLSAITANEFEC